MIPKRKSISALTAFLFAVSSFSCQTRAEFAHALDQVPARFKGDTALSVVMVNVNGGRQQGDAFLVSEPGGRTILIDTGREGEAEENLMPFLARMKVSHIDEVFITHPHWDHFGGLFPLLKSPDVKIGRIYIGEIRKKKCVSEDPACSMESLALIRALAQKKGTKVSDYKTWTETNFKGGAKLKKIVQFGESDTPIESSDINDFSLIAALEYGDKRILFTGDLNRPLSLWLVENRADLLKSDILKAPHHGTEGCADDSFFQSVSPKIVLVPAPRYLWCDERSKRIRAVIESLKARPYVNGIHGHVFVYFAQTGMTITTSGSSADAPLCDE